MDIWVFNQSASEPWAKRVTAVFEMHQPEHYKALFNNSDPDYLAWLGEWHDYPIFMLEANKQIPSSVTYPLDDVIDLLSAERYFTSSVSYALALAGYMDYGRVLLYGVELSTNTEYEHQRPCFLYWYGLLQGRGIEIIRHSGHGLFEAGLYGYDWP